MLYLPGKFLWTTAESTDFCWRTIGSSISPPPRARCTGPKCAGRSPMSGLYSTSFRPFWKGCPQLLHSLWKSFPTAPCCDRGMQSLLLGVALRAANENDQDCQWQSYHSAGGRRPDVGRYRLQSWELLRGCSAPLPSPSGKVAPKGPEEGGTGLKIESCRLECPVLCPQGALPSLEGRCVAQRI